MECAVSLRVAVRHGLISINITYRLAPGNPWPAGGATVE
jgi:acetyl esterase/lipase